MEDGEKFAFHDIPVIRCLYNNRSRSSATFVKSIGASDSITLLGAVRLYNFVQQVSDVIQDGKVAC